MIAAFERRLNKEPEPSPLETCKPLESCESPLESCESPVITPDVVENPEHVIPKTLLEELLAHGSKIEHHLKYLTQNLKDKVIRKDDNFEVLQAKDSLHSLRGFYSKSIRDLDSLSKAISQIQLCEENLAQTMIEWSQNSPEDVSFVLKEFGESLNIHMKQYSCYQNSLNALSERSQFFLSHVVKDLDQTLFKLNLARTEFDVVNLIPKIGDSPILDKVIATKKFQELSNTMASKCKLLLQLSSSDLTKLIWDIRKQIAIMHSQGMEILKKPL